MVDKIALMTTRRYSMRASVASTGFVFDPLIWTADRFARFTGIDVFTLCAAIAFEDQVIGETITTMTSIYQLEFTRTR